MVSHFISCNTNFYSVLISVFLATYMTCWTAPQWIDSSQLKCVSVRQVWVDLLCLLPRATVFTNADIIGLQPGPHFPLGTIGMCLQVQSCKRGAASSFLFFGILLSFCSSFFHLFFVSSFHQISVHLFLCVISSPAPFVWWTVKEYSGTSDFNAYRLMWCKSSPNCSWLFCLKHDHISVVLMSL